MNINFLYSISEEVPKVASWTPKPVFSTGPFEHVPRAKQMMVSLWLYKKKIMNIDLIMILKYPESPTDERWL